LRHRTLPQTELRVSAICLGSTDIGSRIDRDTSFRLLDLFVEHGGNFLDTANVYADWASPTKSISEKTIGAWLRQSGKRDQIVLATKGGHPDLKTMRVGRLSRPEIVHDLDQSLAHLQTEVIDLYWLHRDDASRPVGEIVETLNEQVQAGKIRYFGCSNWTALRIAAAQEYAAQHGLQGFSGDQMLWSLAAADAQDHPDKTIVIMDGDLWRYHVETGLAAIPYSSQANGFFQKLAEGARDRIRPNQQTLYGSSGNQGRFERLMALSGQLSMSVTQLVLGYLMSQPFVTVPIIGCRTVEQLLDSLSAGDVVLTPEQVAYLEWGV
jgi:aryl-alcohol dehydrogenase-like predicted oxidoreductase